MGSSHQLVVLLTCIIALTSASDYIPHEDCVESFTYEGQSYEGCTNALNRAVLSARPLSDSVYLCSVTEELNDVTSLGTMQQCTPGGGNGEGGAVSGDGGAGAVACNTDNTYVSYPNKRPSATGSSSSNTAPTACKALCDGNANCVGYTTGAGNACVTYTGVSDAYGFGDTSAQQLEDTLTATGFTFHRRVGCDCVKQFKIEENTSAPGGTAVTGSFTLVSCIIQCQNTANCVAVDFNPVESPTSDGNDITGQCWTHTGTPSKGINTGVYHATKGTCATRTCTGTFTEVPNTATVGGNAVGIDTTTTTECRTYCTNTANCYGYEYEVQDQTNTANTRCFLHLTQTDLATGAATKAGVNQYRRSCTTTPTPTSGYTQFPGNKLDGGTATTDETVDTCRTSCDASATCIGFDFAATGAVGQKCFHLANTQNPDQAMIDPNVNQYLKFATCPTFTNHPNMKLNGGTRQTNLQARSACHWNCYQTSGCYGYDYNSANECFHHLTATDFSGAVAEAGTQQYRKVPCNTNCDTYTGPEADKFAVGSSVAGVATDAACRAACTAVPATSCLAYVFRATPAACQTVSLATDLAAAVTQAGWLLYTRDCSGTSCYKPFDAPLVNKKSNGGSVEAAATTLQACKIACRANSNCVAIDYNSNAAANQRCWLHNTAANIVTTADETGTNQYRLATACPTCAPFEHRTGKSSQGGTQDTTISTLNDCKDKCLADTACTGFDYVVGTSQCWTHTQDLTAVPTGDTAGTDQYKKKDCTTPTPCDTYTTHANTGSSGGTANAAITQATCQAACTASTTCSGYDFNPTDTTSQCYLLTQAQVAAATTRPGVTQYRKNCGTTPCEDFTTHVGMSSNGGQVSAADDTVDACKARCMASTTCKAIDFADTLPAGSRCYLHNGEAYLNAVTSSPAVTQYRKQDCATSCTDNFERMAQKGFSGGVGQSGVTTVADCQTACLASTTKCWGFDWTLSTTAPTRCWLHLTENAITNAQTSTESDQYQRRDCTTQCTDTFTIVAGRSTAGGTPVAGITTYTACEDECRKVAITACYGFDWTVATGGTQCWLQSSASFAASGTATTGVNQYTRVECTDASPSPSGECIDTFDHAPGMSTAGGEANAATTVETCKAACLALTTCLGFDYTLGTTLGTKCWLQSNPTFQSSAVLTTGVDQYRRVPCADCVPTYTSVAEIKSNGGAGQVTTVATLAACQALCNADTNCVGLDYAAAAVQKCWLHTAATFSARAADAAVTQYTKQPCQTASPSPSPSPAGCVDTFTSVDNIASTGGVGKSGITTVAACETECLSDVTCLGFDWTKSTTADPRCWIHTTAAQFAVKAANTGAMQYTRVPANCPCVDTFTMTDNQASNGGQGKAIATIALCQADCLANAQCVGFDWTKDATQPQRCWIHLAATFVSGRRADNGAQQYARVPCSLVASPSPSPAQCVDTFTKATGKKSNNGVGQSGVTTPELCQAACLQNAQCVGFDWTLSTTATTRCWLHSVPADFAIKLDDAGVEQYTRQDCQVVASTAPPGCTDTFAKFDNTGTGGGILDAAQDTLEKCQAVCLADSTCLGLDFSKSGTQRCWLHRVATFATSATPNTDADQYRRVPCTDLATASPSPTGGCTTVLKEYAQMSSPGGQPQASHATLQACKDACMASATCLGIDWSLATSGTLCWFHTVATFATQAATNTQVNQYRKEEQCDTCVDTFTMATGKKSNGGTGIQNLDLTACQANCVANVNCIGFDWTLSTTANPRCWIHVDLTRFNGERSDDAGVAQYTRVKCSVDPSPSPSADVCVDTFTMTDNQASNNGQGKVLATQALCEADCIANTACAGYDWTKDATAATRCWIHTATTLSQTRSDTGAQQYARVKANCPCVDTFTEVTGESSTGAVENTAINTVDECQAACLADTNCVGLDWVATGTHCWLHTNAALFAVKRTDAGVVQRTRVPCTSASSPSPSVACVDTFDIVMGQKSDGGSANAASDTVEACSDVCRASTTCKGFDWTIAVGGTRCWLHNSDNFVTIRQADAGVNQYVRKDCTCIDTFTKMDNKGTVGGVGQQGISTVEACQNKCREDATCVGFDYTKNAAAGAVVCWLHKDLAVMVNGRTDDTTADQYVRVSCDTPPSPSTPPCTETFTSVNDQSSDGGVAQGAINDLAGCQSACRSNANCLGLDWSAAAAVGQRCWLHNDATLFAIKKTSTGVVQHTKQNDCCQEWTMVDNQGSSGGQGQAATVNTVDLCKAACKANAACLGFDWTKTATATQRCWLHTDAAQFAVKNVDNSAEQYTLDRTCNVCQVTYQPVVNKRSDGGQQNTAATTLDACRTACTGDANCAGFDWNKSANQCWIHSSAGNFATTIDDTTVDQYRKQPCDQPCVGYRYVQTAGVSSQGGVAQAATGTLELCKQKCSDNSACVGFDFTVADTTNPDQRCWLHLSASNMATTAPTTGVDQYKKEPCDGCQDTFSQAVNLKSENGEQQTGITTLDTCKDRCKALVTPRRCYGFDWNKSGNQCWVHFSSSNFATTIVDTTVDQYRITRCESCSMETRSSRTANGPEYGVSIGITTESACRDSCEEDVPCWASEWVTGSGVCYKYYVIPEETASSTSTFFAKECSDCARGYTKLTGRSYADGTRTAAGDGTPSTCAQRCNAETRCNSFDFNNQNNQCFLFLDTAPTNQGVDNNVDHYTVTDCVQPPEPVDVSVAFWVTRGTDFSQLGAVRMDTEKTDLYDNIDAQSGIFTCPSSSYYFMAISSLAKPNQQLSVYTTHTDPIIGLTSNTTNAQEETFHSREAIVRATQGDELYLDNRGEAMGSNTGQQISWAAFNIHDAMNINEYFFSGRTSIQLNTNNEGDVELEHFWVKTSDSLDEQSSFYTCPTTSVYYIFASIGSSRGNRGTRVTGTIIHERGEGSSSDRRTYYMKKLSTFHNGAESTSRAVVIECTQGERVYLYTQGAEIYSDDALQTSLGGFLYDPKHGSPVAWSAYATSSYDGSNQPEGQTVVFDEIEVNVGNDFADDEFVCSVPGTYLVHVTGALLADEPLNINLRKGRRQNGISTDFLTEIDLYHPDTTHADVISQSRTVLMQLNTGDVLRLYVEGRSSYYSSSLDRTLYFAGLLIYT